MKVIKRDGREVKFDQEKIVNAVLAAFKQVDGNVTDYAIDKANNIANYIEQSAKEKTYTVEEIQDLVEKGLMSLKKKDVAKAFILYREKRNVERNKKTPLIRSAGEKITATNIENQNANVDEMSFGGRKGEASNVLMKQYALDYCISQKSKENHLNNEIYIHDLSDYPVGTHNCLTIPFDDLLKNGFNTRQADVRPANSINTAFQLIAVIFQLQSLQQFGGVSASHLDWTMVPYVRKSFWKHFKDGMIYIEEQPWDLMPDNSSRSVDDEIYKNWSKAYKYAMDMTKKETCQAVEGMYHNLNTLQSRSGNQLKWMAG